MIKVKMTIKSDSYADANAGIEINAEGPTTGEIAGVALAGIDTADKLLRKAGDSPKIRKVIAKELIKQLEKFIDGSSKADD